jgi:autoinducer 2 (AI-2) kinase
MKEYLMALDFGTGAGRCFLIATDGSQMFDEYQEWQYIYPEEAQPGGAEFDPAEFWGIFAKLIKATIAKANINPAQIRGISSTSQREGVVFLDQEGSELYAGPNVDLRAPSDRRALETVYAEAIHAKSGHWPFPMFAPYRLLWFKEHRPEVYEKISSMLLLNDWILYRLCGETGAEPSNANETLLFDFKEKAWAWKLIQDLGFDSHIFPKVLLSGARLGKVTSQAAAETGLAEGTPVIMGGADTQCALLGTGAIADGDVGVVLGTFGPLQLVLDWPVLAEPSLAWSGCHVVPDKWVIESTSMEAGQTFRWIRDVFYATESTDIYSQMEQEAANIPAGANGVRAYLGPRLPDYRELRFDGPSGFRTQLPPAPGTASRANFARAALEAVGFGVRINADRLKRISNQPLRSLRASGGLSKSRTLMQTMANLLNVDVYVPKVREGSALGAAILAGVGAGVYKDVTEGVEQLVEWDFVVSPQTDQIDQYEKLLTSWMESYTEMYGAHTLRE